MKQKTNAVNCITKENIQIIGAELKRRRINQSQTLVNLSGVCSISYISKIENGKIIPKMSVLRELCEEQGMSNEELDTLLNIDSLIERCIENMFWNNNKNISNIYETVNFFDNYKTSFIKAIYEMNYQHWEKVEMLLNSLSIIEDNLEGRDYYLYIYLQMCFANAQFDYPKVYKLFDKMENCKDNYLVAMAAKQFFIAEAKYGLECPLPAYEEYYKKYASLFNYENKEMYNLLLESLVRGNFEIPEKIKNELDYPLRLEYILVSKNMDDLDDLLAVYTPNILEKLMIATAQNEFALGERLYKKIQLNKYCARDVIIANYCNYINKADDEGLASYIINVAAPYALNENDGQLYKIFLIKLSNIAFNVGKYKAVAEMNLTYFNMLDKCKRCMLY